MKRPDKSLLNDSFGSFSNLIRLLLFQLCHFLHPLHHAVGKNEYQAGYLSC